ncbi:MAG: hypothetical protein ABI210_10535 [Abditibacteriaceae bacterium]
MKPAFNCKSVFVALACMMASIVFWNNAAWAAQKTITAHITNSQLGVTAVGEATSASIMV